MTRQSTRLFSWRLGKGAGAIHWQIKGGLPTHLHASRRRQLRRPGARSARYEVPTRHAIRWQTWKQWPGLECFPHSPLIAHASHACRREYKHSLLVNEAPVTKKRASALTVGEVGDMHVPIRPPNFRCSEQPTKVPMLGAPMHYCSAMAGSRERTPQGRHSQRQC
jgi:hypothetical protein